MYVVRDVFKAKPGSAKALVEKFKAAISYIESTRVSGVRLITDTVAGYWTVVVEWEVTHGAVAAWRKWLKCNIGSMPLMRSVDYANRNLDGEQR